MRNQFIIVALLSLSMEVQADFQINPSTGLITGYTGASAHITIPETVNGTPVTGIAPFALQPIPPAPLLQQVIVGPHVGSIGIFAFSSQSSLTNVVLSEGLTHIDDSAFNGCASLTQITFPASTHSVGMELFAGCTNLATIDVAPGNPQFSSISGVLYDVATSILLAYPPAHPQTSFTLPQTVTHLPEQAFSGARNLEAIHLHEAVQSIGDNAFRQTPQLAAIHVHPLNPEFMSQDGILYDSHSPRLIRYPPARTNSQYTVLSGVEAIAHHAFAEAQHLETVHLPDTLAVIGSGAFENSVALSDIVLPDSITEIGPAAFRHCISLVAIRLPRALLYLDQSVFDDCNQLAHVTLPPGLLEIEARAFRHCHALRELVVPASVDYIGNEAFAHSGLERIYFRGSAPEFIGSNLFAGLAGSPIVFYSHLGIDWEPEFAGLPTQVWPAVWRIERAGPQMDLRLHSVGRSNATFVVESSSDPRSGDWTPVGTGTWTQALSSELDGVWDGATAEYFLPVETPAAFRLRLDLPGE